MAQPQIYFQCQNTIQSISYNQNITITEIQTHITHQLGTTDFVLRIPNSIRFSYTDNRTLQQLGIVPDSIFEVIPPFQTINILFKKGSTTIGNFDVPDTTFLSVITNQFQNTIQNEIQTIDKILIIDQNGQQCPIQQLDQNQQLFFFFNNQSQIIIQATFNQQIIIEQQIKDRIKVGKEQLCSLVIFKNVTLVIDNDEKVVSYKFHLPQMVQGFVYQEKGKAVNKITNLKPHQLDWIDKNKLKCAELPDGFAIAWENGTISSVQSITI